MTQRNTQLALNGILKTPVVLDFDGGNITSDSGAVLLRELDNRLDITSRFSSFMLDRRDSSRTRHPLIDQFRQRVYQICLGYLVGDPQDVYDFHVGRGDVENRIKELKNALCADRLSCHRFDANRFRLMLHCAAYLLSHQLKIRLQGTQLQNAQIDTIRLKLLKVGARIRQTVRRVWIHAASGYTYQNIWHILLADISTAPTQILLLAEEWKRRITGEVRS